MKYKKDSHNTTDDLCVCQAVGKAVFCATAAVCVSIILGAFLKSDERGRRLQERLRRAYNGLSSLDIPEL
ncbi:MAG: hypothetical protein FWC85_04400 [Elusimicrobia bacterium]|nr:hypothetical protein [Elusimicrobiota bacterium]